MVKDSSDIVVLQYARAYKLMAAGMSLFLLSVIAFFMTFLPRYPLLIVLAVAVVALPLKKMLNFFVVRLTLDRTAGVLTQRRTFFKQTLSLDAIQSSALKLVFTPQKIGRWYPYGNRNAFDTYLEVVINGRTRLYPLPEISNKSTAATKTYYMQIFEPVMGESFKTKFVDIPYPVWLWVKRKHWPYGLATILL